jgi:hypothetical protein
MAKDNAGERESQVSELLKCSKVGRWGIMTVIYLSHAELENYVALAHVGSDRGRSNKK